MKRLYGIFLCMMILFLAVADAGAALYGVDRGNSLSTIDPATGNATLIGALGYGQPTSAFGINPANGQAFSSPGGGGSFPVAITGCIYKVNLTTGAATQVGCDPLVKGLDPFVDFTFHSNGTMYGLRLAANAAPADDNMYLSTVDTATGAVTDIGMVTAWCDGHSISFMPGDVLYGRDSCIGLYTINPTTAAKTVIGFGNYIGFPGGPPGQSHIPTMKSDNGILYGILSDHDGGSGTYYLVSINTTNGDVTYISTLPAGMQNMAFYTTTPVPTINQWGMIIFMVLAGIGAAYHFRRQRRVEN